MLIARILTIALLSLSLPATATDIPQIETLFAQNNVSALQELPEAQDTYTNLFLNYRLAAAQIQNGDKKAAKKVLNKAIRQARSVIENSDKQQEEVHVMLGALYGLKIIVSPFSVIGLNKKANRQLAKAQEINPHNPRALLMLGVAKFQTPGVFGGSSKKALELLKQGQKSIEDEQKKLWGSVDIHLWLGRVYSKLKQPEKALAHYQQALALSPQNHWVMEAMGGNGFEVDE
ncbi:tetratricopeptide repeat protein [Porticoccus sp. GXU_MW_L64]